MKIYNFAMEVYDSPGSGIGCWRSCGQQEWELISHEVILQLLFFPPLIHLTLVTQPFSVGSLFMRTVVVRRCVIWAKNMEAMEWRVSARRFPACVRHVNVVNEGSWHCWMVGLLSWNHLSKVGEFLGEGELRGKGESHRTWWIINKGKGTMFLICQRLTALLRLDCHCRPAVYITEHIRLEENGNYPKLLLLLRFLRDFHTDSCV